ncbi:V-type ATP synthase subunit D [bacterium]|nr:V-type ATP synthase subunit D [bacterium]
MRLNVNPNRMQLLRLKKRLVLAQKGHKLLKDKQDELMKQFIELIDRLKGFRKNVEDSYLKALHRFTIATAPLNREEIQEAFLLPALKFNLKVTEKQVMNLRVPSFQPEFEGDLVSYGYSNMPGDVDFALEDLRESLTMMIELAESMKKLELLADEIDKTRRRVNALEYLLIPNIRETIRYITMKLEELERGNLTRLMKVKDMLEQKEEKERADRRSKREAAGL